MKLQVGDHVRILERGRYAGLAATVQELFQTNLYVVVYDRPLGSITKGMFCAEMLEKL